MRAALYIRVSTDDQAKEGFSIEAQKRKLLSYVDSQDWSLSGIFVDDGYSAKDLSRPAMQDLIKCVEDGGCDIVLVYKLDRLTRSASDCDKLLKMFDGHSVKFQSSTESFETRSAAGRLFIRLMAELAQWERETIAERVRMAIEQMIKEGKKPGGRLPYGYDKKGQLISEEADIISQLRKMYVEDNLSLRTIAVELNRDPKTWRRGFEWTRNTVALTLENPFYAGVLRLGSKLPNGKYPQRKRDERVECIEGEGDHESIWSVDQFEEHVRLMRMRSDGNNSRQQEYVFSGLLKCGRCGSSMFGRLTTKRSRKTGEIVRHPYYFCSARKDKGTCDLPMFRQVHIEHLIMEFIDKIRMDRSRVHFEEKKTDYTKELQKLNNDLNALKDRKKKWQYAFVNDLITDADLKARTEEEAEVEERILSAIKAIHEKEKREVEAPEILRELSDLWPDMSYEDKRKLALTVFDSITVNTNLTNVKGVKNKFFDAWIDVNYQ